MNENHATPSEKCWPTPLKICPLAIDIVTSISHEEDALACILSAECRKLNKIIDTYSDIDTLVAIDTSVQTTLERITDLEGVLKAKLDAIIPLLDNCL